MLCGVFVWSKDEQCLAFYNRKTVSEYTRLNQTAHIRASEKLEALVFKDFILLISHRLSGQFLYLHHENSIRL